MSEMKHTPGPWKARDYRADGKAGNAQAGSIWIDCDAWSESGKTSKGGTVAEVYARGTGSSDPAVQEANARLIAAAPDLLEVAQDSIDILTVAIDLWNEVYPHEPDEVPTDLQRRFREAIAKATLTRATGDA